MNLRSIKWENLQHLPGNIMVINGGKIITKKQ